VSIQVKIYRQISPGALQEAEGDQHGREDTNEAYHCLPHHPASQKELPSVRAGILGLAYPAVLFAELSRKRELCPARGEVPDSAYGEVLQREEVGAGAEERRMERYRASKE
jgi:hypothetical protein